MDQTGVYIVIRVIHVCTLATIMRPNFHEQSHHFVLYNYSLLSLAFFASVILSGWKPLSLSVDAPFLLHSSCRTSRVFFCLNCLLYFSLSLFSFSPLSSLFYLKTNHLFFPRLYDLFLSLSPRGHFVHVPSSHSVITARSGGSQFFSPPLRRFSSRSSRDFSVY